MKTSRIIDKCNKESGIYYRQGCYTYLSDNYVIAKVNSDKIKNDLVGRALAKLPKMFEDFMSQTIYKARLLTNNYPGETNNQTYSVYACNDDYIIVDNKYINLFSPKATIYGYNALKPISVYEHGDWVGIICPIRLNEIRVEALKKKYPL